MDPDKQKKLDKWFWRIVLAPIAFIFIMIVFVALFAKIPSFEELEDPESNLATLLISEDGKVFNDYHIENRSYVKYEDLPQHVVDAAVATEDARFFKHSGILRTSKTSFSKSPLSSIIILNVLSDLNGFPL